MRTVISWMIVAAAGVFIWYSYGDQIRTTAQELYRLVSPCGTPVTYRIGYIDPDFHLSTSTVVADLQEATNIWNNGTGRKLFAYDPAHGTVIVSFQYDQRQATTEALKTLGANVDSSQQTYQSTKASYQAAYAKYLSDKNAFTGAVADYRAQEAAYIEAVDHWNTQGGAPKSVYAQLQAQKLSLQQESAQLMRQQSALNAEVQQVNALATQLNKLIDTLNLTVAKYNQVGLSNGGEFEEAVFERIPGRESITVYEYENHLKLVRVLAHELGHALGLEHIQDPTAIMYELNQGDAARASVSDVAEVNTLCHAR